MKRSPKKSAPSAPPVLALFCLAFLVFAPGPGAADLPVEHRLEVELIPATHRLIAVDTLRIQTDDRPTLVFSLSDRATHPRVEVNGKSRPSRFSNAELEVPITLDERLGPVEVGIAYEAVFNDPLPADTLNTDNPGFGVTATITQAGTFLLAGAGWYPDLVGGRDRFVLKVKAPAGVLAVTAGRSLGHATRDGSTFSEWKVDLPLRGLALSAAAYRVRELEVGDVTAVTYFLPPNQDLAQPYLEAVSKYLKLYSGLFGPYPFPKFAVVENFFPTGYGFPSYALLGSTVLRLPFILSTSLGHEIAHCWWGNGVLVDYEDGNWSEALTTYVSDYLYKEMESAAEARSYRLQASRNYAALVPPASDLPLARFMSRTDTVSKAVGYDKGAMVFHMLRRAIGEEAFWGALRDIYRHRLFQATSWDDLRQAFEKRAGQPLDAFFDQWVKRKGAPKIRLEGIRSERLNDVWTVTGRLTQDRPFFRSDFELMLAAGEEPATRTVSLSAESAPFEFTLAVPPRQLTVDPDYHILRRLDPTEIPPTVNSLKSSPSTVIVLCGKSGETDRRLADVLVRSLGLKTYSITLETDLDRSQIDGRDIILIGFPSDPSLLATAPPELRLEPGGFMVNGLRQQTDSEAFFGVLHHPSNPRRVAAIFLPLSIRHAESVAGKITHYGRYSYLVFEGDRNRDKGTWMPGDSPALFRWE